MKLNNFIDLKYFVAAWNGKEKAAELFWLYYIVGSFGVFIFDLLPVYIFMKLGLLKLGVFISFLIMLVYIIWIGKALWSCAFNVKWRGWGYIIRGIVLLHLAALIKEILVLFYELLSDIVLRIFT